jgi:hypothetical protein
MKMKMMLQSAYAKNAKSGDSMPSPAEARDAMSVCVEKANSRE